MLLLLPSVVIMCRCRSVDKSLRPGYSSVNKGQLSPTSVFKWIQKEEHGGEIMKYGTYQGCHTCDLKISRDFRLCLRLHYSSMGTDVCVIKPDFLTPRELKMAVVLNFNVFSGK